MPKGFENHTVSLTKNGYQKLKDLIKKYPSHEILDHLHEIRLDRTQAMKMLAGNEEAGIPDVWDRAKAYPDAEQHALLMISIIFSHYYLINLFADNTHDQRGRLDRRGMETKTYTNLAYAMNELGLSVAFESGGDGSRYDWRPILAMPIGPLVREVLWHQLTNIGLGRGFYDECLELRFNQVFGLDITTFKEWLEGKNILQAQNSKLMEVKWEDFPEALSKALADAGLKVDAFLQQRFVYSLLTKPFVILTGLAGSGKTKLAQAMAYWLCKDRKQVCMVSVGADWTNREPLLGYPNALENKEYCKPDNGALELLLQAGRPENANKPYFLILDEMNLSHVERYFADFLSAMESSMAAIALHGGSEPKDGVPGSIKLSPNVYIVGTVNIDETTYMFSPKVLDRAQVIEFRIGEGEMRSFLEKPSWPDFSVLESKGADFGPTFVKKSRQQIDLAFNKTLTGVLMDFFNELKLAGAEFGFRTASEMLRFIHLMSSSQPQEKIIDAAILQKLLPKIHGPRRKIDLVLIKLAGFCLTDKNKAESLLESKESIDYAGENIKYPLSLEKIVRMYKRAVLDGFTSYAEA